MDSRNSIEKALDDLRKVIEATVRAEQLKDQLTELPNDFALTEWLENTIQSRRSFWIAFFEIDHFKRKNDAFGYEIADSLLKAVGRQLKISYDFFPGLTQAFRAHGDEFYLLGIPEMNKPFDDRVESNLDKVRDSISRIRINVRHKPNPMDCTVSVGWLTSDDVLEGEDVTARKIRELLEAAVSEAKGRGRNTVVKYSKDIAAKDTLSIRDVCRHCKTRFVADVPKATYKEDRLFCPNCGEASPKPQAPVSSRASS